MLAACNGTARQMRGVGAPDPVPPVTSLAVAEPETASTHDAIARAARNEELQAGTPLHVAPQQSAYAPASQVPPAPDMALTREEAIEQIRAKSPDGDGPSPGTFRDARAATRQMSRSEQDRLTEQMRAAAARNAETLTASEADSKASRVRNLRYRAQSHYESAVKQIEQ